MDFVNYSVEQMQELRQKNTSLESKLSALENHLHDAKYDMEKQTLEYQTELKLVQNAVSTARFLLYVGYGVHSQKRHRLGASCGFYRPNASCQQVVSSLLTSSSCIKSVNIRLAAT